MFKPIHHKSATLPLPKSISRSPLRHGFLVVSFALALALFAPLPTARAQLPPPAPDGGYPNGNTAEGTNALFNNTSGSDNTATGDHALFSNTTGGSNTATGVDALLHNTTGGSNTATGLDALFSNTTGFDNTANGWEALAFNTTGCCNTANGWEALVNNTTGNDNTATGLLALARNTTGNFNTATGRDALASSIIGNNNTATGAFALTRNAADNNTATGVDALQSNTNGHNNTANGFAALNSNTTGSGNTANGDGALQSNTTGGGNTAEGFQALDRNTTGLFNIAVGFNAGLNLTTGSNNIDIGNVGSAGESNTIRIGTKGTQTNTFIAGISGVTVAGGVGVIIDTKGHLGTVVSSERFKEAIKPMDEASEAILALKPVTFRYKKELDPEGIPQFGLVAEQVEKVNSDLVVRDADGKINTVRYEAVNAMLLNEFLKEHHKVQELESKAQEQERKAEKQEAMIAQQQKGMEILNASLKEQAAQIQKVSDQLEASKGTPQIVVSNQ